MNQNQVNMAKKDEVLEGVLQEFAKLAAIPRKSGHEQAVSDFLKSYLSELGFTVTQDEANNIIADKKGDGWLREGAADHPAGPHGHGLRS